MKKKQILILIIFISVTFLGYIYIFGDSGLIVQSRLNENLTSLYTQIKDLENENIILNKKILHFSAGKKNHENDESDLPAGRSIILKFENQDSHLIENTEQTEYEPDLLELRSLYLVSMFFITLVAVTLSVYLSGNKEYRNLDI